MKILKNIREVRVDSKLSAMKKIKYYNKNNLFVAQNHYNAYHSLRYY
jgi:hypothetical protein